MQSITNACCCGDWRSCRSNKCHVPRDDLTAIVLCRCITRQRDISSRSNKGCLIFLWKTSNLTALIRNPYPISAKLCPVYCSARHLILNVPKRVLIGRGGAPHKRNTVITEYIILPYFCLSVRRPDPTGLAKRVRWLKRRDRTQEYELWDSVMVNFIQEIKIPQKWHLKLNSSRKKKLSKFWTVKHRRKTQRITSGNLNLKRL